MVLQIAKEKVVDMSELIIILGLVCFSLIGSIFFPKNKYIKFFLLVLGACPLAYFYIIKYYYVDYAANTAGAYILFSSMCLIIAFTELKGYFPKISVVFEILQIVNVTAAACYMWFYGSKVSVMALMLLIILLIPRLLTNTVLRSKVLYIVYIAVMLIGSIGVRIVTRGNHDGLTYIYTKGGVLAFAIAILLLGYWLFSNYEYACKNRGSEIVFACITVCFVLLWLNPCMIQTPLVLFILVLGYSIRSAEYDREFHGISEIQKKCWDNCSNLYSRREKMVTGILLYTEFAVAVILLGPLEIFGGNKAELYFGMNDFFPYMLVGAVLLGAVVAICVLICPNRLFTIISAIVFSIEIAMYAQTMFMNIKLWETNGFAMNWDSIRWFFPINAILWSGIICMCLVLLFKEYGKEVINYITSFLIIIQVTAIVFVLISSFSSEKKVNSVFLSDTEYTLAKDDNIIVFILDCTARDYLDKVREEAPDILDNWQDFTEYRNANSDCGRTYPSITHMITGYEYDENELGWRQNAWNSDGCTSFTNMLHDSGYSFNIYSKETLNIGDYYELEGKVDNIQISEPIIDSVETSMLLLKASIYRELPYVLKPYFEVYSQQYDDVATFETQCPYQNYDYYDRLVNDGLTISNTIDNQLSITHIIGMHGPLCSNEKAEYVEESTKDETLKGLVYIIDEYLSQMKELGKYDDSTIIITADHSDDMRFPQPIYFVKKKNEHHDVMPVSVAPIAHRDFQGTISEIIGQDSALLGRESIWDFGEDDIRTRTLQGETWNGKKNTFFYVEYEGGEEELVEELRKTGIIK